VGPGDLTLAGYVNYSNSYDIDAALLPIGVPSQYTQISAYTTVDLALHYNFGENAGDILQGVGLTVSAQNVFDAKPPLVINTSSSASIQFDPANASPIGRQFTFQLSKKF
jgi:iron complex outermembrane receptor protein